MHNQHNDHYHYDPQYDCEYPDITLRNRRYRNQHYEQKYTFNEYVNHNSDHRYYNNNYCANNYIYNQEHNQPYEPRPYIPQISYDAPYHHSEYHSYNHHNARNKPFRSYQPQHAAHPYIEQSSMHDFHIPNLPSKSNKHALSDVSSESDPVPSSNNETNKAKTEQLIHEYIMKHGAIEKATFNRHYKGKKFDKYRKYYHDVTVSWTETKCPHNDKYWFQKQKQNTKFVWNTAWFINSYVLITSQSEKKKNCAYIDGKARGNIYISPLLLRKMMEQCDDDFIIDALDAKKNENLAYNYFNESIGMQCIDGEIKVFDGVLIVNIDILDKNQRILYVIAHANDDTKYKAKWNVIEFKTAQEIDDSYGINACDLPISSRDILDIECVNIDDIPLDIIDEREPKSLPIKVSNRVSNYNDYDEREQKQMLLRREKRLRIKKMKQIIDAETFRISCKQSWNENTPFIPVIHIRDKKHSIEYKKYIKIYGKQCHENQYFAVSLRLMHNKWRICCIDTSNELVYYQHRLIGSNSKYLKSYEYLAQYPMIDI